MKTKIIISFICCLFVTLCSCTHNNGDIGPFFGLWKMTDLKIDGKSDSKYTNNVVWKFQSTVIAMTRIKSHHDSFECYGTWDLKNRKQLNMKFIYHDNNDSDDNWKYKPLQETYLPTGVFTLEIHKLSSKRMELFYVAPTGTCYQYFFEKW